jgi:hypothetical protein
VAAWTGEIGAAHVERGARRLVARLEREADEIRGALDWAAGRGGDR